MPAIVVDKLSKTFRVPEKEPGLLGSLRALVKRKFRDVHAVEEMSFTVEPGELVGFLGANGAGKTTTLKMLSGLLYPTSGTADVLGYTPWERKTAFQKQFSLVMGQRSQLWWEIAAQETFHLNQKIYEMEEVDFRRNLGELSELLALEDTLNVPVKKLSLGQRMRAELAVALLHRPKLLLLDEPTLGLDVVMQKKVRQFLIEYNRRHGATVLLTSHNMDDVVELCKRVIIIEKGRKLFDGELRKVVEKYATHKVIRADFSETVSADRLGSIGRVISNGGERAVLEVPRKEVSRKAADLLSSFPVIDLTIEETPLDDVVRKIFSHEAAE